jgi:hypothetical protein
MNATATITGIQLSASNLPLPDVSTWFAWYYERNLDFSADANTASEGAELLSSAEGIDAIGTAIYALNGIEISSEFGSVFGLGNAELSIDGVSVFAELQTITASSAAIVQIDGLFLQSIAESITSLGNAKISVSGQRIDSSLGEIFAQGVSDALVSISGVQLSINQGNVFASALNPDVVKVSASSGRYSADTFKSAIIAVRGVTVKIEPSNLNALGVISVNGSVSLQNVGLYSQAQTITSEGVLSISEEELVTFLMAA